MAAEVDLSEFEALSTPGKRTCPVGEALRQLTGDDLANLKAALAVDKGRITGSAIATVIKRRFPDSAANQQYVASHRNQTCTCHVR